MRDDAVRVGNLADGGVESLRATLAEGRDVLVDAAFGLTVLAGEDEAVVRGRIADLLRIFPLPRRCAPRWRRLPRPSQAARPITSAAANLISFPRAMHRSWPNKYVPDEIYMVHIEREIAAGVRPIVFSDHPKPCSGSRRVIRNWWLRPSFLMSAISRPASGI